LLSLMFGDFIVLFLQVSSAEDRGTQSGSALLRRKMRRSLQKTVSIPGSRAHLCVVVGGVLRSRNPMRFFTVLVDIWTAPEADAQTTSPHFTLHPSSLHINSTTIPTKAAAIFFDNSSSSQRRGAARQQAVEDTDLAHPSSRYVTQLLWSPFATCDARQARAIEHYPWPSYAQLSLPRAGLWSQR